MNYDCANNNMGQIIINGPVLLRIEKEMCTIWNEGFTVKRQINASPIILKDYLIRVGETDKGQSKKKSATQSSKELQLKFDNVENDSSIDKKIDNLHQKISEFQINGYHAIGITIFPIVIILIVVLGLLLYNKQ